METIPFNAYPDQDFKVVLDDQSLQIRIFWNSNSKAFYIDLKALSFDLDVRGLRLCTNVLLLQGLAVREIGDFMVIDLEEEASDPTYDTLGTRHQILYIDKSELGYDTF